MNEAIREERSDTLSGSVNLSGFTDLSPAGEDICLLILGLAPDILGLKAQKNAGSPNTFTAGVLA